MIFQQVVPVPNSGPASHILSVDSPALTLSSTVTLTSLELAQLGIGWSWTVTGLHVPLEPDERALSSLFRHLRAVEHLTRLSFAEPDDERDVGPEVSLTLMSSLGQLETLLVTSGRVTGT